MNEDQKPVAPQDTQVNSPAEKPKRSIWIEKNRILLIIIALLVVGAGVAAYALLSRDEPVEKPEVQKVEEVDELARESIALPGLDFEVPNGWTASVQKYEQIESVSMYSPEALPPGEGYAASDGGQVLSLLYQPRDLDAEAKVQNILDAYISKIGAPRLGDPEASLDEQEIDRSQLMYFKNKSGVDMLAYAWSYEGCSLQTLFVHEAYAYSVSLKDSDDECPKITAINSDMTIKTFIDSIKLVDGEGDITASALMIQGSQKESRLYGVYAANASFQFTNLVMINGGTSIPKIDSSGNLTHIVIGPSAEVVRASSDCQGCGFLYETYDAEIRLMDTMQTEGYEKIDDTTYGKVEVITPLQSTAKARRYTYIKQLDGFALKISYSYESMDEKMYPLFALRDAEVLAQLASFKKL